MKAKAFELTVSSSYSSVYVFRIRVDAMLARQILRRMNMCRDVYNLDSDADEMTFWDASGEYWRDGTEKETMDDTRMVVGKDRVLWSSRGETQGGDLGLAVTDSICRHVLEKIAGRAGMAEAGVSSREK